MMTKKFVVCALFFFFAVASVAAAGEKYSVSAFVVEKVNGVTFSAAERRTLEELKKLVADKANLFVTEVSFSGKMEKLNFSTFQKGKKATVTVAIFPKAANLPQLTYLVKGGYFVAADPKEVMNLLKKYL